MMTNTPAFDDRRQKIQQKIWAIIPAAGIGARMASAVPKQYLLLGDHPVIEITLQKIVSLPFIAGVVVALHPNDTYWQSLPCAQHTKIHTVVGGETRQASVAAALAYLDAQHMAKDDWLFVHDAARPCVSVEKIHELCVTAIGENGAAILAKPVSDTVKKSNNGTHITTTENRDALWLAHTPQMFRASELVQALDFAKANNIQFTDEASAVEAMGNPVRLVVDASTNMKITRPEDLALAQCILEQQHKV